MPVFGVVATGEEVGMVAVDSSDDGNIAERGR
jgi:hypothetical protein